MSTTKRIIVFIISCFIGMGLTLGVVMAEEFNPAKVLQSLHHIQELSKEEGVELKASKAEVLKLQMALQTNELEATALKANEKKAVAVGNTLIKENSELKEDNADLRVFKWRAIAIFIGLGALVGIYVLLKIRGLIPW